MLSLFSAAYARLILIHWALFILQVHTRLRFVQLFSTLLDKFAVSLAPASAPAQKQRRCKLMQSQRQVKQSCSSPTILIAGYILDVRFVLECHTSGKLRNIYKMNKNSVVD